MEKWTNPVVRIVKSQLQVGYPAYFHDFKNQFIFFNGSIPKMHNQLKIFKKVWRNSCMSSFRHLLTFNIVTGCDNWLLDCDANTEYVYSRSVTQERDRERERESWKFNWDSSSRSENMKIFFFNFNYFCKFFGFCGIYLLQKN